VSLSALGRAASPPPGVLRTPGKPAPLPQFSRGSISRFLRLVRRAKYASRSCIVVFALVSSSEATTHVLCTAALALDEAFQVMEFRFSYEDFKPHL
jgi:hypothetical protein